VHRAGLLHRDIKPENILFSDGHAMLADFGLAKALAPAGDGSDTEPGFAAGTPFYMSPEQVTGTMTVDGRSDIYSLGCVSLEALAGRPPFTGGAVQAVMYRHLTEEPYPLRTLRPEVSPRIADAVARALAKKAEDRFQSAADFVAALSPAAGH